jgi:hypothetical protein
MTEIDIMCKGCNTNNYDCMNNRDFPDELCSNCRQQIGFPYEKEKREEIVLPSYDQWNIYVFNVYRSSDIIKFLQLLEEMGGNLQTVVPSFYPNGISSGWIITYALRSDQEKIEMEVLC